jgi:hypothetical protein
MTYLHQPGIERKTSGIVYADPYPEEGHVENWGEGEGGGVLGTKLGTTNWGPPTGDHQLGTKLSRLNPTRPNFSIHVTPPLRIA